MVERLLATSDRLAVPLADVLRSRLGEETFLPTLPPGGPDAKLLPVCPTSTMTPGQTYPSAGDPNHLLFLPKYDIASTPGAVLLKASGAPATDIGTLTVNITYSVPAVAAGQTIEAVSHVLRASLTYSLLNAAQVPTTTVTLDFATVTDLAGQPGTKQLVLPIHDAGLLGQVALALSHVTWSPSITLVATMQVAVHRIGSIQVNKADLLHSMLVNDPNVFKVADMSNRASLLTKGGTSLGLRANMLRASPQSPGGDDTLRGRFPFRPVDRRLIDQPVDRVIDRKVIDPPVDRKIDPPVDRVIDRKIDPPVDRVIDRKVIDPPVDNHVDPPADNTRTATPEIAALKQRWAGDRDIGIEKFHLPPGLIDPVGPIFTPPKTPPDPMPADLVTVAAKANQSVACFRPYPGDAYQLGEIQLAQNKFLKRIDCDGLELWNDEAVPRNFYYLPRSFRLSLVSSGGDEVPTLLVGFNPSGDDPTQTSVSLTMQLLPHIDRQDLSRARAKALGEMASRGLTGEPVLSVQEPPVKQLEWWIPSASGPEQSLAMAAQHASFRDGISVTLDLSYAQFQRVIDLLLVPWADGLSGQLGYTSPGDPSLTQSVPIEVNLRRYEGQGVVVSVTDKGPGHATMTMTNVLDADVHVDGAVTLQIGSAYFEVDLVDARGGSLDGGFTIASGDAMTVVANAATDLSPLTSSGVGITWEATPTRDQLVALCASFIGAQGYAPETFPLIVETLGGYFRAIPGKPRLTKIRADVTTGASTTPVELTPNALAKSVAIAPPLLLHLIGDAGATKLSYRITNVYDDGTTKTSGDLAWDGGSPLVIAALPPEGQA